MKGSKECQLDQDGIESSRKGKCQDRTNTLHSIPPPSLGNMKARCRQRAIQQEKLIYPVNGGLCRNDLITEKAAALFRSLSTPPNLPAPTDCYFRLLQLQIKPRLLHRQRSQVISKYEVVPVNLSGHWVMGRQGLAKSLVKFPKSQ